MKLPYVKTYVEVSNVKNAEGLSGADKMDMNMSKMDEGSIVLSEINAEQTFLDIITTFNIDITEEEIDYYIDNLVPDKFRIEYMYRFYASYFGNFRDIENLEPRQQIYLLILMKKKLILDNAGDPDNGDIESHALPYILTSNVKSRLNNRQIRNAKFKKKNEDNADFEMLTTHTFKYLLEWKPDILNQIQSTFIQTQFTYVAYDHPELLGQDIEYTDDLISTELNAFLRLI